MSFLEKWLNSVRSKDSVLCAGIDPADFEIGRKDESLPADVLKSDWAKMYIEAVAPFAAAVKPNFHYWKGKPDAETLDAIFHLAGALGLPHIEDSKFADIGSTNDAGMFYASKRSDAVTIAPYAGNMDEIAKQAKARNLGVFTMCLMTNPQYAREKNMLVPVSDEETYHRPDLSLVEGKLFVKRYIQLAHDASKFGLTGVVVGAPSADNHISEQEIEKVALYIGHDMLVLMPGIGKQKGFAQLHFKYFGKDRVIANVGRQLMFPNGAQSSPHEQYEAAKRFASEFNEMRI
ncbi:MAG: orotidine 5'-phosphate decarboxylase / HUMPS family protein [Candidatus Woesearchaeota archaeon]